MSPENLWRWAQLKGISIIGTGDFTHPKWFKELNEKLQSADNGLFMLRSDLMTNDIPDLCKAEVFFILTAEISCIYSKNGKTRKIHSLIFTPNFADAAKINIALSKIGNLNTDGRPILGLDAKELLKIVLNESPDSMLIPAHAWTPHFSIFGAASGFDYFEECFEELTPHIYAIETGLSSDPLMNWRLSALDKITLISNSDAHSPKKIGREANIFDIEISYKSITDAIKTKNGFIGTIEFFPEEGKYHYDGHRACGISMSPKETIKNNYLCPVCGKEVTIGVMHRIERLADREEGFRPKDAPPFYSIIPLPEIIADVLKIGVNSKKVDKDYQDILNKLGSEFKILMDIPIKDIEQANYSLLAEAISQMRKGDVYIAPGYDGEYGKIKLKRTEDK
ncbi:helicase UvrD [Dissulfurispira thermophila]|uniref:Helicase UvrD n=2 Tax=root TaxID=1 RepID=A0A7G1GY34_9BACT|nr:helicase UvrD [Dissulfurispira thermophila]